MSNTVWDQIDIFRTDFKFSTTISSVFGKGFTILYLIAFIFFSIQAIIIVFMDNTMSVSNITTYDADFIKNDSVYYQRMNIIVYIQLYSNANSILDQAETTRLLDTYLQATTSSFENDKMIYRIKPLGANQCGVVGSMAVYCLSYDVYTKDDFLSINFNKPVLASQDSFDKFIQDYTIRFHINYYFTQPGCKTPYFFKTGELNQYLISRNVNFHSGNIFEYILTTHGSHTVKFSKDHRTENSITFNFKNMNLVYDTSVLIGETHYFNSFVLGSKVFETTTNLISFNFRILPIIETYIFRYKKLQASFAEIGGIMGVFRFAGYFLIVIINNVKQQLYFSELMYKKNIVFSDDVVKNLHDLLRNKVAGQGGGKELFRGVTFGNMVKPSDINIELNKSIDGERKKRVIGDIKQDNPEENVLTIEPDNIENQNNDEVAKHIMDNLEQDQGNREIKGVDNHKNEINVKPDVEEDNLAVKVEPKLYRITEDLHLKEVFNPKAEKVLNKLKLGRLFLGAASSKPFNLGSVICLHFCGKFRKSRKVEADIIQSMFDYNTKKMDYINILEKIERIDVLTYILLNDNQKFLLKYVDKFRLFYDTKDNKAIVTSKYNQKTEKINKLKGFETFFQNVKNNTCSFIDKKLFEILDEDLVKSYI
jgi:hypothetical protein